MNLLALLQVRSRNPVNQKNWSRHVTNCEVDEGLLNVARMGTVVANSGCVDMRDRCYLLKVDTAGPKTELLERGNSASRINQNDASVSLS